MIDSDSRSKGGEGGGGSHLPDTPSFLVSDMNNVNARFVRARDLITMWDFLEYKGRVGRTHVIMNLKDNPTTVKIMPVKYRSRHFEDGRLYMSRKIRRRLGRYEKVPGLMQTLTYDPKATGKRMAWSSFGKDTRRFINAVNQYRRRGWRRLHYLWVVQYILGLFFRLRKSLLCHQKRYQRNYAQYQE